MVERRTATKTVNVTQARQNFSQLLNQVYRSKTRLVVEKSGIPVAAIISARDLERFDRWEAERDRDFAILEKIGQAFKDVPPEEIEREVAKAIAEIREEDRQRAATQSRA